MMLEVMNPVFKKTVLEMIKRARTIEELSVVENRYMGSDDYIFGSTEDASHLDKAYRERWSELFNHKAVA